MTTYSTGPRLNHCCENLVARLSHCQTEPRTTDELIYQAALRKMPASAERWANLARLCWEESERLRALEVDIDGVVVNLRVVEGVPSGCVVVGGPRT